MQQIVKAEILWDRRCNLKCNYCGMVTGKANTFPIERWKVGFEALKKLGCGFCAFYGAEPLKHFIDLPEIIQFVEDLGMKTTIITSGVVTNFYDKLDILYDHGLRSLTMSNDLLTDGLNISSRAKSKQYLDGLYYFKSKLDIRDVAAVTTLTRTNYNLLIPSIKLLSSQDIWTFYDFIHPDRGIPGTKCRNYPGIEKLLFTNDDLPKVIEVLEQAEELRNSGYLVHSGGPYFMDIVRRSKGRVINKFAWHCAYEEEFPAWLTIDCDGTVGICDDYKPPIGFPFDELEKWQDNLLLTDTYAALTKAQCSGCCWGTHIGAMAIKKGIESFDSYVHTEN